jgi:hypothetical protein
MVVRPDAGRLDDVPERPRRSPELLARWAVVAKPTAPGTSAPAGVSPHGVPPAQAGPARAGPNDGI